ncbi:hypothetical protein KY284_012916 [Solanum tuberosum]|nr:hypothetical protein KY284_012916 [Solanum tuberosum]
MPTLCQICGRNNHTALKCFYTWDYSYQVEDDLLQTLSSMNMQNITGEDAAMDRQKIVGNGSQLAITYVGNLNKSSLKVKDILDKKSGTPLAKGSNAGGLYQLEDNNLFALTTTQDWKRSEIAINASVFGVGIRCPCDGGGEFIQIEFVKHLETCGIIRQIYYPHSPEQKGVSKRKHRHIVETGLTLLFHAKLPQFLWVEAFLTVVFLINRMPSLVLKHGIPFVKLFGASPDYNSLENPDTSSSDTITLGEVLDNLNEKIAPATITVVDTQVQPDPSGQVLTNSSSEYDSEDNHSDNNDGQDVEALLGDDQSIDNSTNSTPANTSEDGTNEAQVPNV